ncbi:hypothetical protein AVEN_219105-1 [Araneus ventricosus]|uniref:Uncharacterized protein n=1 Tax=Araneus ventricosus TaxID=182803 RepID=A0A4Y2RRQ6_ARAVE|nr:hypothetical protein AVEN_265560-1 [Araneus ventricosus]GBN78046.1 hypothetical protein AVEN_219105-1 [Araneus ventricosus]
MIESLPLRFVDSHRVSSLSTILTMDSSPGPGARCPVIKKKSSCKLELTGTGGGFSRGDKKFNICTKCNMIEATPQHLLDCVAFMYDDLLERPYFVLEVMRANDLMDLIRFRSERRI